MEPMRDVLRSSLGRSLRAVSAEDRLSAAWTVACGRAMAERGTVVGFHDGIVRVQVSDAVWMQQMISLRGTLAREMSKIAGVKVDAIEFVKRT